MQSIVGQSVVQQCDDYTCNHCGALFGVVIVSDNETSQRWQCSMCQGFIDVRKLADNKLHVARAEHGPKRDEKNFGRGCCLCAPIDISIAPEKQSKKALDPGPLNSPPATQVFNEPILKAGEDLISRYFQQQNLSFVKGFALERKCIDYCVSTAQGPVLLDNADLEESNFDKAVLKAGISSLLQFEQMLQPDYVLDLKRKLESLNNIEAQSAGGWNPHERIQKIIKDKVEQFKPAKGKFPCVIALFNAGSAPVDYDLILRQGVDGDRYFRANRNTTISAIAVVESYSNSVRLRVYRNKYAAMPLPTIAFPGSFDFDESNMWDSAILSNGD